MLRQAMRQVSERECAGQAALVRDLKGRLDRAMDQELGWGRVVPARQVAQALARELETYETMCERCEGV
ncbi:hypothetical protein NNJEOMEG_03287 [Fundidesulfovibrio magnetotacticus]|uniref:Uncharacterized protein n=1 Tax=Fundidesulfovibrio magnetotacticus TaxID=2730080 RepID=A0A6V8LUL2_9BACT|nr:hypothetical protein [Fundidesulfovibrio magnetotacticus]GFK95424.1 hypothetical protein NNJEOMEG_03287 [Fundidesulfovibrio magnetotacticus]